MGFYRGPNIVTNGLVLNLDAANVKSYPGSGTTWRDLSGNNNTGTLTNGPTFSSANGGSISFDGTNDCVIVDAASSGSAAGSYTLGGWVNPNTLISSGKVFISRGRDNFGNGWSMQLSVDATNKPYFSVVTTSSGNTAFTSTGTTELVSNTWCYLVGTWTAGSNLKIYFNGLLEGTTNTSTTNLRSSTNGIVLASIRNDLFYNVSIASVHYYNRVLLDQEIFQNYNSIKSRFNL
jgi:hypothetical protein